MKILLFVAPLALIASGAFAQQQGHDACARDVARFCRSVMNDGDAVVLQCLQRNRTRISHACNKIMTEHGQ